MIKEVFENSLKALGVAGADWQKSKFFLLIFCSPAFVCGWLIYSSGLDYHPFVVILSLAALSLLGSLRKSDIWYFLLAILLYIAIAQISILSIFAFPFFLNTIWCSQDLHSETLLRKISIGILLAVALLIAALKIQWGDFYTQYFIQSIQFYVGFLLLVSLALTPLFFIRLKSYQGLFYGAGFLSIFTLIGFGFDWGFCIYLYTSLLFISLVLSRESFTCTPAVGRISTLVIVLYALLWNIPTPFLGQPGLGLYGVIYQYYPALKMEDPLKHPFWREAAERYDNIHVGTLRNNLPPDSEKLRFLLGRVGMKSITFVDGLNSDLKSQAPNSNTLYLLDDWRFSPNLQFSPNVSLDLLARINGYLVYAPGWKVCKDCREIAKDLQMDSIPPKAIINGPISFADGQEGVHLLGEGWSRSESWGTWTDGGKATFYLPRPDQGAKKLTLNLRAFISPKRTNQVIRILLDGKLMGRFDLDKGEMNIITLDLPPTQNSFYRIDFDVESPVRPVDLGINKDQRLLGVALVSLKLE